jgi:hypothetical protein
MGCAPCVQFVCVCVCACVCACVCVCGCVRAHVGQPAEQVLPDTTEGSPCSSS